MKKFYFFLVALMLGVMSASAANYYLVGGFNGWANGQAKYKFTDNGNGTYVLNMEGQLTSDFKVTDGTWNDSGTFGGNGSDLELGETYTLKQPGSNIKLACSVVDNPKVVFNPTAKTLVITGAEAEVEISYDIWGNLPAASSSWSSTSMENIEGDIWVAEEVTVTATSNFGIRELTNGAQSNWISADGTSAITGPGVFRCKIEGTNFSIAPGTYNLTFDAAAYTLTVTGEGSDDPTPDPVATYYMIGDFNGWALADAACKFTQSETNKAEYILDYVGTLNTKGFKINDGTWSNDNVNFGSNGAVMQIGVPYSFGIGGSTTDIVLAADVVNPHVVLNSTAKTLTITTSSAVEGVEVEENVAPVYYNLQGVRVDAPANGLYIVVRGNKVAKELVK